MFLPQRFVDKVELHPSGCWLWKGWTLSDGYGSFNVDSRKIKAHRFSYEGLVGPIPEGLHLDHLCLVKACINPSHLEPVTPGENVRRSHEQKGPKTHCTHGHEYTADNTYLNPRGYRECRTCGRQKVKARRSLLKQVAV